MKAEPGAARAWRKALLALKDIRYWEVWNEFNGSFYFQEASR
jgi:hypothetical protein